MRIADVKIGGEYLAKVSGALVKVVAYERVEPSRPREQASFRCRRADNGKPLGKTRAASALRPLPAPDPIMEKLINGMKAARVFEAEGKWAEAVAAWESVSAVAMAAGNRPRAVALANHSRSGAQAKLAAEETAK